MKRKILATVLAAGMLWMAAGNAAVSAEDFVPNPDNYVDVDAIDLSLHAETSGDFTPVYVFDNPFLGKDTKGGVIFEFYAKPTWEVHELGTIFAIQGTEDYDGRIYFTPGSYFGFNSPGFGGYFDANLYNYAIVNDYIKDGAKIRIELYTNGFSVYANDVLCYDQSILNDETAGAGDYVAESDFTPVLDWLCGAQTLYFGYGSWWNTAGSCAANINLSQVSFRLADGTEVFGQLKVDKELIERLGGSVELVNESTNFADSWAKITNVDVEIFDINAIPYESRSILPVMAGIVLAVAVLGGVVLAAALKKRHYDDI